MVALACDHLCCLVRSLCPYVCAWLQMCSSAVPMNCYICKAEQFVAVPCTQAEFDRLQRRVVSLEAELAVFVGTRRPDAVDVAPTVPVGAPVVWCRRCLRFQPCVCFFSVGVARPDAAGARMLTQVVVPQPVVDVAPTVPIAALDVWCCLCLGLQPCRCSCK